jgi:Sigma-70 factor, region 1.2
MDPLAPEERDEPAAGADSLECFLFEIGRRPLLTAAEEVTLAKRIEQVTMARRDG